MWQFPEHAHRCGRVLEGVVEAPGAAPAVPLAVGDLMLTRCGKSGDVWRVEQEVGLSSSEQSH